MISAISPDDCSSARTWLIGSRHTDPWASPKVSNSSYKTPSTTVRSSWRSAAADASGLVTIARRYAGSGDAAAGKISRSVNAAMVSGTASARDEIASCSRPISASYLLLG